MSWRSVAGSSLVLTLLVLSGSCSPSRDEPLFRSDCHWDCGEGHSCEDGVIHSGVGGAIPCDRWTGSCPTMVTYTCERGCRTDGVTFVYGDDPALACEEGRPKVAGDTCTRDEHCQPPSTSYDGGVANRMHLECDEADGHCIPIPDPTPVDWLGPCGVDPSEHIDTTDDALSYGYVVDHSCSGGVCLVDERESCIRAACAMQCEHDWECPDGAGCTERRSWSYGREGEPAGLCIPEGYLSDPAFAGCD